MGAKFLQLVANIFIDVLERVKKRWHDSRSARAILNSVAQILFRSVHQPAIGVVDDHELPGVQQIMRYNQGTQAVFSDNAAGISNDMGIAVFQAESESREPRIHTSQHGEVTFGARREPAQFVRTGIEFVCCEDFVDYAHGLDSLANRNWLIRARGTREGGESASFRRGAAGAWGVLCQNIRRRGQWLRGHAACGQSIQSA